MRITRRRFFFLLILLLLVAATMVAMSLIEAPHLRNWWRQTELTIHWDTDGEANIAGFNLYRADSPGGEFVRINETLIVPGILQTGESEYPSDDTSEYTFVDKNVVRGRTYYYQLAIVYRSGQEVRKGPYAITAD